MNDEVEVKMQETKKEEIGKEIEDGDYQRVPLNNNDNNNENSEKEDIPEPQQSWGQWFAGKVKSTKDIRKGTFSDPELGNKIKESLGNAKQNTLDVTNKAVGKIDEFSTMFRSKFHDKYPETSEGLKKFSDEISCGVILGYDGTAEGQKKFKDNVSEAWSTNYGDAPENFDRWKSNVKSGLITGYDATAAGFEKFKENSKEFWETAKETTYQGYESFRESINSGTISGFEPTEEGYQQWQAADNLNNDVIKVATQGFTGPA